MIYFCNEIGFISILPTPLIYGGKMSMLRAPTVFMMQKGRSIANILNEKWKTST